MRIKFLGAATLLTLSALSLSACATGLNTRVSRYQAMPAPQGQSFVVVPMNPNDAGGLEFSRYAALVAQNLQAQGYAEAPTANQATLVVHLGYGVDDGNTEIVSDPFYYGHGFGGYGWGGYGRRGYYWGWNDPFWYGPYGGGGYTRSYTYYKSQLDLDIRRKVDNVALFEGKAKARSRTDELAALVPSLIDAMFTGFPGHSGETIKITIPSDKQQARAGSY